MLSSFVFAYAFLPCFLSFPKIKVAVCDLHAVCVSVIPTHTPINLQIVEQIFMKVGMYIMALELISTTYFINPSHQSVCLYVYPFVARRPPGKPVPAAKNTRNNIRIVRRVFLWVCLCIPLSLLGSNVLKIFPRQ
jgi:hypothetical protein